MINLPSDSFPKTVFFGGIALIVAIIIYSQNSMKDWDSSADKFNSRMFELQYENSIDSLELITLKKKLEYLRQDSVKNYQAQTNGELEKTRTLVTKNSLLHSKRSRIMNIMNQDIRTRRQNGENDNIGGIVVIVLGGIMIILGIKLWADKEQLKDKYEELKLKKEHNDISCQSCGMNLQYDFKPYTQQGFCSLCFNGEGFTEPDLTYKQMLDKVENQMKSQGIEEKHRKKHLARIGYLNRWNQALRWRQPVL